MTSQELRVRIEAIIAKLRDGDYAYLPDPHDDGQQEAAAATQSDVARALEEVLEDDS